mgnify:CR=1 FL=1
MKNNIKEYFEDVETKREYNGYFCKNEPVSDFEVENFDLKNSHSSLVS